MIWEVDFWRRKGVEVVKWLSLSRRTLVREFSRSVACTEEATETQRSDIGKSKASGLLKSRVPFQA